MEYTIRKLIDDEPCFNHNEKKYVHDFLPRIFETEARIIELMASEPDIGAANVKLIENTS